MWKNKEIEVSTKLFDEWTLVLFKDSCIFATSKSKGAVELNMNLEVVTSFMGRDDKPFTIDANENYVVIGYDGSGYVDIHNRKELDQDKTHQKRMVSKFIYSIQTVYHRSTDMKKLFAVPSSRMIWSIRVDVIPK